MGSADMQMTFPGKREYTDNRCHPTSEDYKILKMLSQCLIFKSKYQLEMKMRHIARKNQFVPLHTTVLNVDNQQHNGRRPVDGTRSVSQPVTKRVTKMKNIFSRRMVKISPWQSIKEKNV